MDQEEITQVPLKESKRDALMKRTHSDSIMSLSERVILNIGGTRFETYVQTLTKYSDTLRSVMFDERNRHMRKPDSRGEYFFDRSPVYFGAILEYYRSGKLKCPPGIPWKAFEEELDYWQIPGDDAREGEKLGDWAARMAMGSARHLVSLPLCAIVDFIHDQIRASVKDGKQAVVLEFKQPSSVAAPFHLQPPSSPPSSPHLDFYSFLSNFSNRELLLHDLLDQHLDVNFTDVTSGQGHSYILTITLWNRYSRHKVNDTVSAVNKILEELRQGVEIKTQKSDHVLYVTVLK